MVSDSHDIVCFRVVAKEVDISIPNNGLVYDGTLQSLYFVAHHIYSCICQFYLISPILFNVYSHSYTIMKKGCKC